MTSMTAVPWLMLSRSLWLNSEPGYSCRLAVGSASAMHARNSSEHIACDSSGVQP
jgi:hypothetical protein